MSSVRTAGKGEARPSSGRNPHLRPDLDAESAWARHVPCLCPPYTLLL